MEKEEYYDLKSVIKLIEEAPASCFPDELYGKMSEKEKTKAVNYVAVLTFLTMNNILTDEEAKELSEKMTFDSERQEQIKMAF